MGASINQAVQVDNYVNFHFPSKSENEALARIAVASFVAPLDPTLEEMTELKTAVSEAVTNAIIHGYENTTGEIHVRCSKFGTTVTVSIEDDGVGIENVEEARQPMYTSRPELERSGMGMTIMESFVDHMSVESTVGFGTRVTLVKTFGGALDRH
jgi:stage II sporulation protein AB (anti-sigma F factor)